MVWGTRKPVSRLDGHKSAIGDAVLRIIKRGDAISPVTIRAILTREGQERAAIIVAEAEKVGAGTAPPSIIVTKPQKRKKAR